MQYKCKIESRWSQVNVSEIFVNAKLSKAEDLVRNCSAHINVQKNVSEIKIHITIYFFVVVELRPSH